MGTHEISFPGLGIEEFVINRVAFNVFGIDIYWYAVFITLGIVLAAAFGFTQCKKFGIKPDDLLDGLLFGLPAGVIGARLFSVLFNLQNYHSFLDVINIRDGGLAIWGGIISVIPTVIIFSKVKKINFLSAFDITAVGLLIGQAVGRWGNFFNAEVYGIETNLPWGMTVDGSAPVHPLFLYEIVINTVGIALILLIWKKYKNRLPGDMVLFYMSWYGLFRALLEMLRPSKYVLYLFDTNIPTAVLLGFTCFVLGIAGILVRHVLNNKKIKAKEIKSEE